MKGRFTSMRPAAAVLMLALSSSMMTAAPAMAVTTPVNLKSAANFAVLAGTGITNTGTTAISGDVGTYPTVTETGFDSVTFISGTNHGGDAVTQTAKTDLDTAYIDAAGRTPYIAATTLGGLTPVPGVYHSDGALSLTGILTLTGDAESIWIFQAGSTLDTAGNSQVILSGGARAENVYWQVGSSATLGANSVFKGNIMALASITMNAGAAVEGRALARNGTVTLANNTISAPPTWLSYRDSGHAIPCDNFADASSEHTVYMSGAGFVNSHQYRVAYYDGTGSKRVTDDISSTVTGILSSNHTFAGGTDAAGTWYVIVCERTVEPPSVYDPGWAFAAVTDIFVVQPQAIPEFPTAAAGIITVALCGGIYLMLKKKYRQTSCPENIPFKGMNN